ncbi:solute carrier family 12 member 8 [Elysia marginata]|uniref:Solute carrier family 12 member 8 n=1 Tax=Elysia marginata TaxID=1093978 RepID=A0AAV4FBL4_9GAST|nr:solute carrier family 12 member 8 [Elysia marginata]
MSQDTGVESAGLIGGRGRSQKGEAPDWSRFGLSKEPAAPPSQKTYASTLDSGEAGLHASDVGQQNELYREEQLSGKHMRSIKVLHTILCCALSSISLYVFTGSVA